MFRSIGFIGGGRVTRILLGGWNLGHALPEDVIDLIPVKPLSDDEEAIREIYRSRLTPLYRKLKG